MAAQAFAPGTNMGSTVAYTTSTTLLGEVHSIEWTGLTRQGLKTIHLLSTDGVATYLPGDVIEPGQLTIRAKWSTQLDYMALFLSGKCDTITLTYPKRPVSCGASLPTTAATLAWGVVLLELKPVWSNDEVNMIEQKLQCTGKPTFVAAVV